MINQLKDEYCMYLRKSRTDAEAEARGEGETLARHEKALLELARRKGLNITQIYRELVSAETIAARPIIRQLLEEVEQGRWTGVLVMEVERLARGDTMDQGLVAQTFKFSDTKIVTLSKTYDPGNEFDEEYFEFGLFMSRREYKTINRRLQRGRAAAAKEGKYVASRAPYGYEKIKIENDKGYTLKKIPEQAKIVWLIFSWYIYGAPDGNGELCRLGIQQIARKLNQMRIPPSRHDYWQKSTIRDILINPVYAGKIRWRWRPAKSKMVSGVKQKERPRNYGDDCILATGLHEAIINEDMFKQAQEYLAQIPVPPVGYKKNLINPLAGLVYCGECGRSMTFCKSSRQPGKKDYIVCHARACSNVSSPFHLVEASILDALGKWLSGYQLELQNQNLRKNNDTAVLEKSLKQLEKVIETLNQQADAACDLLEQGIYSTEQFLERTKRIAEKLKDAKEDFASTEKDLGLSLARDDSHCITVPEARQILDVYRYLQTPAQKNQLLKEVLEKVVYTKSVNGSFRNASAGDFDVVLYPRLPQKK